MYILSIDPGPEHSGIAVYDSDNHRVIRTDDVSNTSLLGTVRNWNSSPWSMPSAIMAIEGLENQGHFVGKSTFETAEWIGRFREAWEVAGRKSYKIYRRDVKTAMCGGSTYRDQDTGALKTVNDTVVSRAVRSRFPAIGGGKRPEVGTKVKQGPLYGVKGSHQYSAIAIALTWMEIHGRKEVTGWFNVAGIGIDGCEMLVSTRDEKEIRGRIFSMELRARMNSHRKISLFTWGSSKKVEIDDLKTHKQRAAVIKGATKIF